MLKLGTIRFKGRCSRHPRFNPEHGEGAIRGGCPRCQKLYDIHIAHTRLVELIRLAKNDPDEPTRNIRKAERPADDRQALLF
jgi:hypothetical protein